TRRSSDLVAPSRAFTVFLTLRRHPRVIAATAFLPVATPVGARRAGHRRRADHRRRTLRDTPGRPGPAGRPAAGRSPGTRLHPRPRRSRRRRHRPPLPDHGRRRGGGLGDRGRDRAVRRPGQPAAAQPAQCTLADPRRRRAVPHRHPRRPAGVRAGADAAAARTAAGRWPADRGVGRAVVVAGRLPRARQRHPGDAGQRDPPAGRRAHRVPADQPRRDPFVLDPVAGRQARQHSRPHHHAGAGADTHRHVRGHLRRVLRDVPRADGVPGRGDGTRRVRPLARGTGRTGARALDRTRTTRRGGVHDPWLRRVPHRARHARGRPRRPRPHPRGQPPEPGRRHPPQRCRRVPALDRPPRPDQARRADARFRNAARRRPRRDRRLPGGPAMSATGPVASAAHGDPGQAARLEAAWATPTGWRYWSAVNNSNVGLWYTSMSFVFFLFAGVLALLMRVQLAVPDNDFVSAEMYNQLFSLHGSAMMFLFAVPIFEAFSMLVLPQLLGARDLPFPRLSAFGFWCFRFGGVFVCGPIFFNAAPQGGWFMYPPLTTSYQEGYGADIWLLGLSFIEVASIAAAVELITGTLKTRPPGMRINLMPLYA